MINTTLQILSLMVTLLDAKPCEGREATGYISSPHGYCTGVLIRGDTMITAAHCVRGMKHDEVTVGFGPKVPENNTFDLHVKSIALHPTEDLAVVSLYVDTLRVPASLPKHAADVHLTLSLEGYGIDEHDIFGTLRCRETEVGHSNGFSVNLEGFCFGDSGGGSFHNNTVHSVNSFVIFFPGEEGAEQCDWFGAAVDLFPHVEWIEHVLAGGSYAWNSSGCQG